MINYNRYCFKEIHLKITIETKKTIEIKNLFPIVAMISTGKSKILKLIFVIDFLEANVCKGRKFINIFTYNPNI